MGLLEGGGAERRVEHDKRRASVLSAGCTARPCFNATVTLQAESTERKSEEDKNSPAFVQSTPSLHSVMVQSLQV